MNQAVQQMQPLDPVQQPPNGSFGAVRTAAQGAARWSRDASVNLSNQFQLLATINNNKAVGSAVAAAATIEVSHEIHHITGTATITTINAGPQQYGPLYLVADAGFFLGTGGNISASMSVAAGEYVELIYDPNKTTWYVPASINGTPVTNEVPSGTVNGTNTTFTLAHTPITGSVALYRNGLRQTPGTTNDYTISGATITFNAGNVPQVGDNLLADYRY